jgi:endonuclease G
VVAVVKPDGALSATAYLISQTTLVNRMLEFAYGAHGSHQRTIREIERLTGLSFHHLAQHDPLAASAHEGAAPPAIELDSLERIVL